MAILAKNWDMARRLIKVKTPPPQTMFDNGLLHLLLNNAPQDLIDLAFQRQPDWFGGTDALGRNILHFICAHGQVPWLERLGSHVEKLTKLWSRQDKIGRRPIDYRNGSLRQLGPEGMRAIKQPLPVSWDSGIKWELLPRTRIAAFLTKVGKENLSDVSKPRIEKATLPLCPGVTLFRLTCPDWPPQRAFYYLQHKQLLVRLDGTSPPFMR